MLSREEFYILLAVFLFTLKLRCMVNLSRLAPRLSSTILSLGIDL